VLEAPVQEAPLPDGISIRRVDTEADAAAFASVNGQAYATYGMPEDVAPACLPLQALRAPHIHSFVAWDGETPLGGAMVHLSHGIGGLYWVGTTPAGRGRGVATACTRVASNVGFALGARMITLQASVMGEPIYRRLGYIEVGRYPQLVAFDAPISV
jgi:GNAT superfamily N-acetyltransferase